MELGGECRLPVIQHNMATVWSWTVSNRSFELNINWPDAPDRPIDVVPSPSGAVVFAIESITTC